MKKLSAILCVFLMLGFTNLLKAQEYVLEENYNDNKNGWDISNSDEAVSKIKNGKYIADIKSGIYWLDRLISLEIDEDKDWVLESAMVKKSGDVGYGLTWGGNNLGSRFNFYITSDQTYTISKWKDYNVSSFFSAEHSDAIKGEGKTNKLTIKKEGQTLKFYVNDTYLKQIDYEPLQGKYFGFYGNSGALNIEVDYLKLYYTGEKTTIVKTDDKSPGTVVFNEEFDDNSRDWPTSGGTGIKRSIKNGKYVWEGLNEELNSNWDFVPITLDQDKDFIIDCSIKKISGPESGWGLGLLWGDDQNRFSIFGSDGKFSIVGDIYARNPSSAINTGNASNKMTIKKIGDKLQFFVNDTYLSEADFKPFSPNQIGIYTYMNNVRLEVDYIKISYLKGDKKVVTISTDNKTFTPEEKLVSDFITIWVEDSENNDKMMGFISPKYFKANKLDKKKYNVNLYYPKGYEIKGFDKSKGLVTVLIWGEDKKWTHRLTFKVVKIKKKLYLYPSKFTESMYIYPWDSLDTYVEE